MDKKKCLTKELIYLKSKNSNLQTIKTLNVWGCDLEDVSILQTMPNLEVISLSVNKIKTLKYFENLPNLKELYLRKNLISDISEIRYLGTCPSLKKVWLKENPISALRGYRYYVIKFIPDIENIDEIMVGNEERQMARNFQGEVEVSNPNDDGLRFSHDYEKENNNVIYEGNRRKQKYNNNNKYNNNYEYDQYDKYYNKNKYDKYNKYMLNENKRDPFSYNNNPYIQQQQYEMAHNKYNRNSSNDDRYEIKPGQNFGQFLKNYQNNNINTSLHAIRILLQDLDKSELLYVLGEIDKKINKF
jgi:hypothetical protein